MHEIVVLSGKGGAGKTSVTTALAAAMAKTEKLVLCDYDVDAPDLHILLKPEETERHDFVSGFTARFNADRCIDCLQCLTFCRFDAISKPNDPEGDLYKVDELHCEGCSVCVKLCPQEAFDWLPRHCGEYFAGKTRFGTFIHAQLTPGSENSGRLITVLKRLAKDAARREGAEIILSDGTPGIGCPVISSLSGASLVCAVVEATQSGITDFARLAELANHFRLSIAAIINKADLSESAALAAEEAVRAAGGTVLGRLPYDPVFTKAMSQGLALPELDPVWAERFETLSRQLLELARAGSRNRTFIPIKETTK